MKREKLETFLGKNVRITFMDDCHAIPLEGFLFKCNDKRFENNINFYYRDDKRYVLSDLSDGAHPIMFFRTSHVKKCELV